MAQKEVSPFDEGFLEDTRRFMLTQNKAEYMYKHLGIRQGQRVLDVGCGTGYFSRQIAQYMKGAGHVVGLDVDARLIEVARHLAAETGTPNLEYVEGNALQVPYPSGTFDVTICHFLLCVMPAPHDVLAEMVRVTRHGGYVAAVEPCVGAMGAYYPGNDRLTGLLNAFRHAVNTAERELCGIDQSIGPCVPEMLAKQGLLSIRTEVVAMPLTPPPFPGFPISEALQAYYERQLASLDQSEEQILSDEEFVTACESSGVSRGEQLECRQLQVKYMRAILSSEDPTVFVNAFESIPVFAVVGMKPSI